MLTFSSYLNMRIQFLLRDIILLLAFLSVLSASGEDPGPLHLEKEIPLPGVEGRIDHFSADVAGQRLFIAALENGSVEILDTRQGERIAEIKGLEEPQGVYYDSKTNQLYVATGGDGKLRVYEGKALTAQRTLEFGDDADNVRYDGLTGDIWVGYGNGGIGIVNSAGQKVGSVDLGTHPESFQFDQSGDRAARSLIYVIGGEGSIEVLRQRDPDHYERIERITTEPGARTGLLLQNSSRLYVAVPHRGSQAAKVLVYTIAGS
jgi:hypothetical protein